MAYVAVQLFSKENTFRFGSARTKDDDEPDDFMEVPEGKVSLIIWVLCLPVYIPLYYTLPVPQELHAE